MIPFLEKRQEIVLALVVEMILFMVMKEEILFGEKQGMTIYKEEKVMIEYMVIEEMIC